MAQISLRDYLKEIHQMIEGERFEQAFAHVKHVLEYYPRNVDAYRLLGRVLVYQRRWDEAEEVFRRLLSVLPNDTIAHAELSRVYQQLGQEDRALWHIERAFDQAPNNERILSELRTLYGKVRGQSLERVQLTSGAVAAQYLASDLNEQAIEVLRQALERMPERIDLRLQLARALWRAGRHVDAAESAIEVLGKLPYALSANRIMTELWLQEQRPSDAQRYLSRIEDVDPYLAMGLATGTPTPSNSFMLDELDYQTYTHQALSAQSPDWLENVEGVADERLLEDINPSGGDDFEDFLDTNDDWLDDLTDTPPKGMPAIRKKVTDELPDLLPDDFVLPDALEDERQDESFLDDISFDGVLPDADSDDWLSQLDSMENIATRDTMISRVDKSAMGLTGMLAQAQKNDDDDDLSWLQNLDDDGNTTDDPLATGKLAPNPSLPASDSLRVPTGFTGMIEDFDPDDEFDSAELDGILNSFDDPDFNVSDENKRLPTGFTEILEDFDPNDPTGMLSGFDPSMLGEAGRVPTGFTGTLDEYEPDAVEAADLDGILDSFGSDELILDDVPDWLTGEANINPPLQIADDDDTKSSWMRDAGIELSDADSDDFANLIEDDESISIGDRGEEDPMGWMTQAGIELDESAIPEPHFSDDETEDPTSWMKDAGIVIDDEAYSDDESIPDLFGDFEQDFEQEATNFEQAPPEAVQFDDVQFDDVQFDDVQFEDAQTDWDDESALDDWLALEAIHEGDNTDDTSTDASLIEGVSDEEGMQGQALMSDEQKWQNDDDWGDEFNSEEDDGMAWLNDDELIDDFLEDESFASTPETTDEGVDFLADFDDIESDGLDDAFSLMGTDEPHEDETVQGFIDEFGDSFGGDSDAPTTDDAWLHDADEWGEEEATPASGGMLNWLGTEGAGDEMDEGEALPAEADWLADIDADEIERDIANAKQEGFNFDDDIHDGFVSDGEQYPLPADNADWMAEEDEEIDENFFGEFEETEAIGDEASLDWMLDPVDEGMGGELGGELKDEFASALDEEFGGEFDDELFEEDFEDDFDNATSGMTGMLAKINATRQDSEDKFGEDFGEEFYGTDDEFGDFDEEGFTASESGFNASSVSDTPDWLNDFAQDADIEAIEVDAQPDWLSDMGSFDPEEFAEAQDSVQAGEGTGEEGAEADWMNDFDENFEEEGFGEVISEESAEANWMNDFDENFEEEDFGEVISEEGAEADWMNDFDENFEEKDFGEVISEESAEADWMNDFDENFEEKDFGEVISEESAETDWMNDFDENFEEEGFGEVISEEGAEADWMNDFEENFEEEGFSEDFEEGFQEEGFSEIMPTGYYDDDHVDVAPASNAPDWLNAMVPGLDVDYEAENEDGDDVDYAQATPAHRDRKVTFRRVETEEFDWLTRIVADEEREGNTIVTPPPPPPMTPPPPPPLPIITPETGETGRRKFLFDEPPAWLRQAQMAFTASSADDISAVDFDDDDLSFDDDMIFDDVMLDDLDLDDDWDGFDDLDNNDTKGR